MNWRTLWLIEMYMNCKTVCFNPTVNWWSCNRCIVHVLWIYRWVTVCLMLPCVYQYLIIMGNSPKADVAPQVQKGPPHANKKSKVHLWHLQSYSFWL